MDEVSEERQQMVHHFEQTVTMMYGPGIRVVMSKTRQERAKLNAETKERRELREMERTGEPPKKATLDGDQAEALAEQIAESVASKLVDKLVVQAVPRMAEGLREQAVPMMAAGLAQQQNRSQWNTHLDSTKFYMMSPLSTFL